VTDLLPAGLTLLSATPSQGTYTSGSGMWTVGTVSTGVSQTLIINALVASPSAKTNTAAISHADQFDPITANNSASATEAPPADLQVAITDGATTVVPGTGDTYMITVTNNGPDTVSSVTLTDTIPAALLNPIFGTPSAGSYDPGTRVWSGLSLASSQSVTITLTGTIDPSATGSLTNTVTVAGTADTNPGNNSATDVDTLTPQADLAITKTDGTASVAPGTPDTYTIVVSNSGRGQWRRQHQHLCHLAARRHRHLHRARPDQPVGHRLAHQHRDGGSAGRVGHQPRQQQRHRHRHATRNSNSYNCC